jgi:hypothetical protein
MFALSLGLEEKEDEEERERERERERVLIRDCLPSALLILAYRIECFLFCGFI